MEETLSENTVLKEGKAMSHLYSSHGNYKQYQQTDDVRVSAIQGIKRRLKTSEKR
jgi:hypothetical protein